MIHRGDNSHSNIPVGIIPAGSGNGLAKSLCEYANEEFNINTCAYSIIKGKWIEIDLMEIEMPSEKYPVYSFHSFAHGFVCDVGFESEV